MENQDQNNKKIILVSLGIAFFIISMALFKRKEKPEKKKIRTIKITKTKTITPKGEENDEIIEESDESDESENDNREPAGKSDDESAISE
jgi:hypothetical protein